jgi:hypothetical protein
VNNDLHPSSRAAISSTYGSYVGEYMSMGSAQWHKGSCARLKDFIFGETVLALALASRTASLKSNVRKHGDDARRFAGQNLSLTGQMTTLRFSLETGQPDCITCGIAQFGFAP